MKKLFLAILLVLFISTPSMAFLGDVTYIDDSIMMGDKNHHNTIVNGDLNSGTNAGGIISNKNTNINTNINTNKNTNINTNINKNTNIQGQAQGQAQGQIQGQTAHNEGVNQTVVFEQAETKRDHLIVPDIVFAPLGTYKESANHGSEFTKFDLLTKFKKNYSYDHALKHYDKAWGKGKCITSGGSYNGRHEEEPTGSIEVVKSVDLNKVEAIGILTIKANPKYTKKMVSSFVVLQKAVLSACIMQGTKIMFIDEGATTKSENSGWGVGWNGSGGIINDMDNRGRSASSSAGTGYSKGSAWLRTLPWLTVYVFKDK